MSVESALSRYKSLSTTIGKKAISALYPNDIELYIVALELVNSDNQTESYFLFPVQPFSIGEQNKPIQTIKKTAGGVTVLSTQTFHMTDTQIQGNFGRKFKFLLGQELVNFTAFLQQPSLKNLATIGQEFSPNIKTGYGCIKVMEKIIKQSNQLDSKGKPYSLYFYNLALGNSYMVKFTSFDFHQNQESNMIWNYSASIKSLIPVTEISDKSQRSLTVNLAANQIIQQGINNVGSSIGQILKKVR